MKRLPIKNLDYEALATWLDDHRQPQFRTKQIFNWLYDKWATSFDEMRNVPKSLREQLDNAFLACSLEVVDSQTAADGTVKYLYKLPDDETIESVLITAGERKTVCVSSQVGCPVRCTFCATGAQGLIRNLQAAEIIDQVVMACRHFGERVTNVVVMGMGEPLLNYDNLVQALDRMDAPEALNIGARRITVSTSGIPDGIRRLADAGRQWNLALSLQAVKETQRARLIPAPYRYPLSEILEACQFYREQTNRLITIEYTLLHGRNCSMNDAERLAAIAKQLHAKVNLIPCNPTVSKSRAPSASETHKFLEILTRQGVNATIRRGKGAEIQAACGQLRARRPPA